MPNRPSLQSIIFRSYLASALLPLVLIELALLALYFGVTRYATSETQRLLVDEVHRNLPEIASREVANIDARLQEVERLVLMIRDDHQHFFSDPSLCLLPHGEPLLAHHSNGAYYKISDNGGGSLYYSAVTPLGDAERNKARCSEALDPLLMNTVRNNPLVTQAYLNTQDNMTRIYPFIEDLPSQFGASFQMEGYNFYYLADQRHNPQRKPVWTGAYLDPAGQGWMMSVVVPIYHGNRLEGVSGLDITVASFVDNVLQLQLPWQTAALLVDGEGRILAMPPAMEQILSLRELTAHQYDQTITGTVEKPDQFNLFALLSDDAATALKALFGESGSAGVVSYRGINYLVSNEQVGTTGWHLLTWVDQARLLEPIRAEQQRADYLGYLVIAIMVLFYIGFFLFLLCKSRRLAGRIAVPIENLTELTNDLGQRDKLQTLAPVGVEEIDALGANFNQMVETLTERTQQLVESQLRARIKEREAEMLERLSFTDELTGLCNRRKLNYELDYEELRARRFGHELSVVMIDLDHFKRVNDNYGHPAGDAVLVQLAELLLANIRAIDLVGRWGGEEFLIICPETDAAGVRRLAENLRAHVGNQYFVQVESMTASFGVASLKSGESVSELVDRADRALYRAKSSGRNRVEVG